VVSLEKKFASLLKSAILSYNQVMKIIACRVVYVNGFYISMLKACGSGFLEIELKGSLYEKTS